MDKAETSRSARLALLKQVEEELFEEYYQAIIDFRGFGPKTEEAYQKALKAWEEWEALYFNLETPREAGTSGSP